VWGGWGGGTLGRWGLTQTGQHTTQDTRYSIKFRMHTAQSEKTILSSSLPGRSPTDGTRPLRDRTAPYRAALARPHLPPLPSPPRTNLIRDTQIALRAVDEGVRKCE
jgi:hypothetical protein